MKLGEYIKNNNGGNMVINGYHDYGAVRHGGDVDYASFKQYAENEEANEDTIYIGSEVETGRENTFSRIMLNKMADLSSDFQCETDGSIRDYGNNNWSSCYSCEIISAPLTYKY